jgi:hypothetical protein
MSYRRKPTSFRPFARRTYTRRATRRVGYRRPGAYLRRRVPRGIRGYAVDSETKYSDNHKDFELAGRSHSTFETMYRFTYEASSGLSNNITKIRQGTTADARIGNVVRLQSLRCGFTAIAARRTGNAPPAIDVPALPDSAYMRTSIRVCIVRDLQVNNTQNFIQYNDVFSYGSVASGGADILAPRNLSNMGRFQVLYDKIINLDSDDPQKSWVYTIPFSNKSLRFNGPSEEALQTKGLYFISAAACAIDENSPTEPIINYVPQVQFSSRLAFKDS